jgi:hypothetical protein
MKLQIFSDLHTDVAPIKPITIGDDVDAVMVAGDTCQGVRPAFASLRRIVPERIPIIMTAGNHEFYRRCIKTEIAEAKTIAGDYNILLLEDDIALLGTTRFIGATLWTNYRVFGDANAAAAMATARRNLNDHRVISWTKNPWKRFRPEEALLLHERSKAFIVNALTNTPPSVTSTVILTHHAPHFGSVAIVQSATYRRGGGIMTLIFAILHVAARVPPLHERAQPPPRTADHVGGRGPPYRQ